MPPSDRFLRLLAIRLAVVTAILYAVWALESDQNRSPASYQATPVVVIATAGSDSCERSKPVGPRNSEADVLLRNMLLHD